MPQTQNDFFQSSIKSKEEVVKTFWIEEAGGLLSKQEVARIIEVGAGDIDCLREDAEILGLYINEIWVYPTFQFLNKKPLPGLNEVLMILTEAGHDDWMKLRFFIENNYFIQNSSCVLQNPIATLTEGNIDNAIFAAHQYMG